MNESKRQKQIGKLIQQEVSDIFQRIGLNIIDGGMISISSVKMTPDLLEARIYLSLFQIPDTDEMLKKVKDKGWEIKKHLAERVKHQLRRIPDLQFYLDDTLDQVFKMEELFKKIHEEEKNNHQ
jgi:ribosome-binding factor A